MRLRRLVLLLSLAAFMAAATCKAAAETVSLAPHDAAFLMNKVKP